MPRALVIHGDLYAFGGAENHCVKVLKILQDEGIEVTLIHAGEKLHEEKISNWVGISLCSEKVTFIQAPPFNRFPKLFSNLILLKYALVLRAAQKHAKDFDIVIGTYGETPIFAKKLVQSIHIPLFFFDKESLEYLGVFNPTRAYHFSRMIYVLASRVISRWSTEKVERGIVLTNSSWTGSQVRKHYPRSNPKTIYHGASTVFDASSPEYLPHSARENNFVIVGRVVPFKQIDIAITIIEELRKLGHKIGLIIIGNGEGPYAEKIHSMAEERHFVQWFRGLSRIEMEHLIIRQRWGLHCAQFEHYGLAPLELQRLGCVTFIHDSGGQAEVISDPRLKYRNMEDAIEKINFILNSVETANSIFCQLPETVMKHQVHLHRTAFLSILNELGVVNSKQ